MEPGRTSTKPNDPKVIARHPSTKGTAPPTAKEMKGGPAARGLSDLGGSPRGKSDQSLSQENRRGAVGRMGPQGSPRPRGRGALQLPRPAVEGRLQRPETGLTCRARVGGHSDLLPSSEWDNRQQGSPNIAAAGAPDALPCSGGEGKLDDPRPRPPVGAGDGPGRGGSVSDEYGQRVAGLNGSSRHRATNQGGAGDGGREAQSGRGGGHNPSRLGSHSMARGA